MTDVVLKFDYIDDEVLWPEVRGGKLVSGWVKAVSGIDRPLLNVTRIKKVYVGPFDGKLYILYDAESVERYSKYMAPLPPLAVELDYDVYPEKIYNGDCICKIYRFAINALYEEERFIQKLLGVEVELEHVLSNASYPLNFTMLPVNVMLYTRRITGIAVKEKPRFKLCKEEDTYDGKYVVLADETGFSLYRIKSDVDTWRLVAQLKRLGHED